MRHWIGWFDEPSGHPKSAELQRLITIVTRLAHAINGRLRRNSMCVLLMRTVEEMSADDATHMAAGVAYYALFSLFPLILGLVTLFSFFMESKDLQAMMADFAVDYLPGSEAMVESNIGTVSRLRGPLGLFAILGLLWSGSAVFGAVNRAVNRAWDVHDDRPFYISKPRQLAMAFGVGLLFLLSLVAASLVRLAGRLAGYDGFGLGPLLNVIGLTFLQGTSFLLTLLIFLLIYKVMPNTKTYWRYIWPGALLGALLFELTKNLFILYLNRFASFENVYGSLAPVIVLLLWTYLGSLILILGAELSSEYGRLQRGVNRGVLLHPPRSDSGRGNQVAPKS